MFPQESAGERKKSDEELEIYRDEDSEKHGKPVGKVGDSRKESLDIFREEVIDSDQVDSEKDDSVREIGNDSKGHDSDIEKMGKDKEDNVEDLDRTESESGKKDIKGKNFREVGISRFFNKFKSYVFPKQESLDQEKTDDVDVKEKIIEDQEKETQIDEKETQNLKTEEEKTKENEDSENLLEEITQSPKKENKEISNPKKTENEANHPENPENQEEKIINSDIKESESKNKEAETDNQTELDQIKEENIAKPLIPIQNSQNEEDKEIKSKSTEDLKPKSSETLDSNQDTEKNLENEKKSDDVPKIENENKSVESHQNSNKTTPKNKKFYSSHKKQTRSNKKTTKICFKPKTRRDPDEFLFFNGSTLTQKRKSSIFLTKEFSGSYMDDVMRFSINFFYYYKEFKFNL